MNTLISRNELRSCRRYARRQIFLIIPVILTAFLAACGGSSSSTTPTTATFVAGSKARSVAIDASGNVWVANSGNGTIGTAAGDSNVTELNSGGAVISTYSAGSYPGTLAIDASGNVWVANSAKKTDTNLDSAGTLIGT